MIHQVEADADLAWREGVAEMVGDFMSKAKFREQPQRENPTLFEKIRDAVLKLIGKFTPEDAAHREMLDWLRSSSDKSKEPTTSGHAIIASQAPGGSERGASLQPTTGATRPADHEDEGLDAGVPAGRDQPGGANAGCRYGAMACTSTGI